VMLFTVSIKERSLFSNASVRAVKISVLLMVMFGKVRTQYSTPRIELQVKSRNHTPLLFPAKTIAMMCESKTSKRM